MSSHKPILSFIHPGMSLEFQGPGPTNIAPAWNRRNLMREKLKKDLGKFLLGYVLWHPLLVVSRKFQWKQSWISQIFWMLKSTGFFGFCFCLWMWYQDRDFSGGASSKESACQCRRYKRLRSDPWVGKIPWRRKWQLTPVFFPGKSHGQRSLMSYSPWGLKESDMTTAT